MAFVSEPRDLAQIVRDGLGALVFAFGYKTGIVHAFSEVEQPCTAEELSQKAGKKLRYIQEWLGSMVATGIVTMTEDGKYSLPHDKSVINMWGHASTLFPIFCELFPKLEEATSQDGPSGYPSYNPFLQWVDHCRSTDTLKTWNEMLLVPLMKLKPGDAFTILDLGCGFGKHSREVAKLYPNSKIFAIDMDERSIEHAKKEISTHGPNNIEYLCTKGGNLPKEWTEKFDFVIINDVLHDSYEVDDILNETKRVLKADGYAAAYDPPVSSYHLNVVQDMLAQFYLPCSFFHCLPVSSMGPSGEGLGIGWGYERKKQKIEEHGFRVIQVGDKNVNTIQEGMVFQRLLKRKGSDS